MCVCNVVEHSLKLIASLSPIPPEWYRKGDLFKNRSKIKGIDAYTQETFRHYQNKSERVPKRENKLKIKNTSCENKWKEN